jgi:hypothetical protein
VEKCGTAGQAADDNIILRTHCACWITKATNIHPEYVIFIAFFAATMVTRMLLNVILYVHCLSSLFEI